MGLIATQPVFGVSDKVRFKPICSATEASKMIKISFVVRLDIILFKGADQSVWMSRLVCAFVVRKPPKDKFFLDKAHPWDCPSTMGTMHK